MADKQILFVLDIRARGVAVEILLNEIVVSMFATGEPIARQVVVNPYVQPGVNRLTARVRLAPPGTPTLDYRLFQTIRAADAPETNLITHQVPDPNIQLPVGTALSEIADEATIAEAFGTWSWQAPGTLRFNEQDDRGPALQCVQNVYDALARRDSNRSIELMRVKFNEIARALQLTPDSLIDDAREHFSSLFASKDWALRPLLPEAIVLRPMAGGAVVAPTRTDGRPLIESIAGPAYKLEMMIAKIPRTQINPTWQVVR